MGKLKMPNTFQTKNQKREDLKDFGGVRKSHINPLKPTCLRDAPTGLTFNNCTFCPHCIYVFCIYLRTNSELCHLQHKLTGFL